jgi:hypothetical protein
MANNGSATIDPAIFEYLKSKSEEDAEVNERLHQINTALNRYISTGQGLLSRIHATPTSKRAYNPSSTESTVIFV